jgi:hypothetical protein
LNHLKYSIALLILVSLTTSIYAGKKDKKKNDAQKNKLSFFQKGRLYDPIMTIDFGANRAKLDQHIYQVREGSIGGYDAVGGNCGCN